MTIEGCKAHDLAMLPWLYALFLINGARLLTTLPQPKHLLFVGLWGFARLSSTHTVNGNGNSCGGFLL